MKNAIFMSLVLAVISAPSMAADAKYGDWSVNLSTPDRKFAYTTNQAGEILGQLCTYASDGADCLYMVTMDLECKEGSEYPVLVNSDAGASHQRLRCGEMLSGGSYRYYFYFDEIQETIENASKISIVFPTKDDQFKVLRFSLAGSKAAIGVMREAVDKMNAEYRPAKETLL